MAITIDGDSGVSGVNGSATTPALQGTDSNTGIVFGTDTVQIATGGSTRATVDSSGNFGLGTTSPTGFSGYTVLDINNATNGAIIDLSQGDAMKGRLVATSSSMATETSSGVPIIFSPAGTEEARFLVGGGLTFNGDTAAANALSDYEEGTWTPVTRLTNQAVTVDRATYTKIGDTVIARCNITFPSSPTSAANGGIGGLPFNASATGSQSGGALVATCSKSTLRGAYTNASANTVIFADFSGASINNNACGSMTINCIIIYPV